MAQFKDRRVLVTGGASGIGAALVEALVAEGARVAVLDVARIEQTAQVRSFQGSVADPAVWAQIAEQLRAEWGGLDLAFLNAGIMTRPAGAPMMDDAFKWMTAQGLQRNLDVNMLGVVHGTEALVPLLEAGDAPAIVVTASAAALAANTQDPYYTMSKYAALGYARAMAPLLNARGIRIASVCPLAVDTTLTPSDIKDPKIAPGRVASTPVQVAADMLAVVSEAGSGDVWVVGGGAARYRYEFTPLGATAGYMKTDS